MAFYGKARVGTVASRDSRTSSRGSSGGSSSPWKNNRGETIPTNRSGKPIYTPDPIQNPEYYKAPEDPFQAVNPPGLVADQFGVAPGQLHMLTRQLTPEEAASYGRVQSNVASKWQTMTNDPRWIAAQEAAAAARASGDEAAWRRANGQILRAVEAIRADNQWAGKSNADRNADWPKPRSTTGNYQYSPGRPGPTPPGVAKGMDGGGGAAPSYGRNQETPEQYQARLAAGRARFDEARRQWEAAGRPPLKATPMGAGNATMQGPMSLGMGGGAGGGGMGGAGGIQGYQGEGGGPGGGMPPMQGLLAALSQPKPAPAASSDIARKAAAGMPAHLLDPNYKPGSRSR